MKQFSLLEIMVVWLLLLLPLLAVDLEVRTSRMPLLQMHTSSNKQDRFQVPRRSALADWSKAGIMKTKVEFDSIRADHKPLVEQHTTSVKQNNHGVLKMIPSELLPAQDISVIPLLLSLCS